ncbi:hypothetical protein, partial [Salmonella sp. s54395]|uniref:hypothetical protein n=1 Tax=Salmonella sp. s54395 TaxID=3159664 RepID=UPI00397FB24B
MKIKSHIVDFVSCNEIIIVTQFPVGLLFSINHKTKLLRSRKSQEQHDLLSVSYCCSQVKHNFKVAIVQWVSTLIKII